MRRRGSPRSTHLESAPYLAPNSSRAVALVSFARCRAQLHPLVPPHVSHFRHVPLRTIVKFAHSGQGSPS